MTETEWLAAADPGPMLRFLFSTATDRKLRLFAVACCLRSWQRWKDEEGRHPTNVAEQFADGLVTAAELVAAHAECKAWYRRATVDDAWLAARKTMHAGWFEAGCLENRNPFRPDLAARAEEEEAQTILLRDIFGNPFRPVAIDPAWLAWSAGTVPKLAQHIYDSRDFSLLPILCDALEEAGCGDVQIIRHCRLDTVHTRGCWVIDLLLDKE